MQPSEQAERAILELYDLYAAKLFRYATSLVRDDSLAQDAVQEAFLRYSLMLRAGRPVTDPKPWLFRVLRNYVLDRAKVAQARNEIGMDEIPDAPAEYGDPEQQYAQNEISRLVLTDLTPRERECLELRSEGLSYGEIAAVLAIRPGTVGTLLSRCYTRIQQGIQKLRQREDTSHPSHLPAQDRYAS